MKTCTKCGEVKALDFFRNKKASKDGLQSSCKSCHKVMCAAWVKANKGKFSATSRAWRKANPEKIKATQDAWKKANPEKIKATQDAWIKANPEKNIAKERRRCAEGHPSYLSKILKIPTSSIPPEVLTLKREQLEIYRLAKQVKQQMKEIKNATK